MKTIFLLLVSSVALFGQFSSPSGVASGGPLDPPGCTVGQTFFNTSFVQLKVCTSPSIWQAVPFPSTGRITSAEVAARTFIWQNAAPDDVWSMGIVTGGPFANTVHLDDIANSRTILQVTPGPMSALQVNKGIIVGDTDNGLEVSGESCGLIMDGLTHSNSANLAACANGDGPFTRPSNGTGILIKLSPGVLALSSPVTFTKDNVRIQGASGFVNSSLCYQGGNGHPCIGSTIIRAVSGSWGDGTSVLTWDGTSNTHGYLTTPGLENVDIDANQLASRGVTLRAWSGGAFSRIAIHDFLSTNGDWGLFLANRSTPPTPTGTICGQGGGIALFSDISIQSYRGSTTGPGTAGGAIRIGDHALPTTDACSNKFINIFADVTGHLNQPVIYLDNGDSNQFTQIQSTSFPSVTINDPVNSINGNVVVTSDTSARVFVQGGHGIPAGATNVAVWLASSCTSPLSRVGNSPTGAIFCGATEIPGLEGIFTASYADSTHFDIIDAYGLKPGGTALCGGTCYVFAANAASFQISGNYNNFPVRGDNTAYVAGSEVIPAAFNGHFYLQTAFPTCTSGGSAPSFPTTSGGTVSDGSCTWKESGVTATDASGNPSRNYGFNTIIQGILPCTGIHNYPQSDFNFVSGLNLGECGLNSPQYSRPSNLKAIEMDGSLYNLTLRSPLIVNPVPPPGPFTAIIDFTNIAVSGYYPLMLKNNTNIGASGNSFGQTPLIGTDSSNNVTVGSTGGAGQNLQLSVPAGKSILLNTLAGSGNALVCAHADGSLYRASGTSCP